MKNENSLERMLTRARTQLLLNQPFFGTLCLRLKLIEGNVPTMATDGRRILFNPEFVHSLQPEELQAVLAHEVLHCALGHHCRRGQRDPGQWNEAADLAINPLLIANGFSLPEGALIDPDFGNLSAEEFYALRQQSRGNGANSSPQTSGSQLGSGGHPEQRQEPSLSSGTETQHRFEDEGSAGAKAETGRKGPTHPGGFGEVMDALNEDGTPASEAERSRQRKEWDIAADQAMRSATACGHEPDNIERSLTESRQSKQDWRSILRDFVTARSPSDYRWNPPNRRFVASGLYLPSVTQTGLRTIVIGVDTSGSIGDKELEQFAREISSICDEAQPECVHVVYCDAAVQGVQEFGPSEPIQLEPKGGGGTDFRPVFHWVEEHGIAPACLIYLTDLCCHSYPNPPEYSVLWVTASRRIAPFGETVQISSE